MTRNKLTRWEMDQDTVDEFPYNSDAYEQIEVDKILDEGTVILNSYKMIRDLYGEDSSQAKAWLEEVFKYMEGLKR